MITKRTLRRLEPLIEHLLEGPVLGRFGSRLGADALTIIGPPLIRSSRPNDRDDPIAAIDLQGDEAYLVEGWYPRENIGGVEGRWTRREVTLRLPLQPQHRYKLTFRALAFGKNRSVSLRLGGEQLATIALAEDWTTYTIDLPQGSFADDLIPLLSLSANGEQTPAGADSRALAVAYEWLTLERVGD